MANTIASLSNTGILKTTVSLDETLVSDKVSFTPTVIIGLLDEISLSYSNQKAMSLDKQGNLFLSTEFDEYTWYVAPTPTITSNVTSYTANLYLKYTDTLSTTNSYSQFILPATVNVGDVIVVYTGVGNANISTDPGLNGPSGYTNILSNYSSTTSQINGDRYAWWYKIATNTDANSLVSWSAVASGSVYRTGKIFVFNGDEPITQIFTGSINDYSDQNTNVNTTPPAQTVTSAFTWGPTLTFANYKNSASSLVPSFTQANSNTRIITVASDLSLGWGVSNTGTYPANATISMTTGTGYNAFMSSFYMTTANIYVPMIATAANTGVFYDASAQLSGNGEALVLFDNSGLRMYLNSTSTRTLYQYTLSTPWDITTATYSGKSLSHSAQTTGGSYNVQSGRFKPNGLSVFIHSMGLGDVFEYTMTTAWDLSTATYSGKSYSMAEGFQTGFDFATDGLSMYNSDPIADGVYQYKLTTPWDVTTASFYVRYNTTSQLSTGPQSIRWYGPFNFYVYNQSGTLYQFKTTVPWDVTAANVTLIGNGASGTGSVESYFKTNDASVIYFPSGTRVYKWSATPGTP